MATTEIETYAEGGSANVLTQAAYAALAGTTLLNGMGSGIVASNLLNKILRQALFIAAGVANFLVGQNINVPDDGGLTNLVNNIYLALFGSSNLYTAGQAGQPLLLTPVTNVVTPVLQGQGGYNSIGQLSANNFYTPALTANITLANPSGAIVPGQSGVIEFLQDGTGGRTITTFGNLYVGANGVKPNLTATAGGRDLLFYYVMHSGNIVLSVLAKPS